MGEAIGQMLPAAVGVAISPFPIVAVVLMLVTPRGRVNAPAFLVGWLIGLGVVGTIVLVFADGADAGESGAPASWVKWLDLVIGVALLLVAVKLFRGRPTGDEQPATPKWMGQIDGFTPAKAAGLGAVLAGVNPKNLLLTVSGASAIARTGISGRRAGSRLPRLHDRREHRRRPAGGPVLRARRPVAGAARRAEDVDGDEQRGDHGRHAGGVRREGHRPGDHGILRLTRCLRRVPSEVLHLHLADRPGEPEGRLVEIVQ